jgi:hypothetical protein
LGQQVAMVTDWTSAIFEESKVPPPRLVVGHWLVAIAAERHRNCRRR